MWLALFQHPRPLADLEELLEYVVDGSPPYDFLLQLYHAPYASRFSPTVTRASVEKFLKSNGAERSYFLRALLAGIDSTMPFSSLPRVVQSLLREYPCQHTAPPVFDFPSGESSYSTAAWESEVFPPAQNFFASLFVSMGPQYLLEPLSDVDARCILTANFVTGALSIRSPGQPEEYFDSVISPLYSSFGTRLAYFYPAE